MSRNQIGLLTAVVLVGIGLAVCLGTLTSPALGEASTSTALPPVPPQEAPDNVVEAQPRDTSLRLDVTGDAPVGTATKDSFSTETGNTLRDTLSAPRPVWATPRPSITSLVQPPPSDQDMLGLLLKFKQLYAAVAAGSQVDAAGQPGAETEAEAAANADAVATESIEQPADPGMTGTVASSGDQRFDLRFQDDDIRRVLEAISTHTGLNIIVSNAVQGTVTANFENVDMLEALDAILKSTGNLARREGDFLYVGTPDDFLAMEQPQDNVVTRIYRPDFVTANELHLLITPMLSPNVGFASVSSAAEVGIAANDSEVGGDAFAGADALLVRDYAAVLAEVDQIVAELDVQPMQVAIEAMILSVRLNDETKMGVSFEFLRNNPDVRFGIGSPANALPTALDKGGLQFAFIDSNLGAFIDALEQIEDTNVIATPRVLVLNKHRAEIQIGKQEGYITSSVTETSTTQSVDFLDTGTLLRVRPFISQQGLIRMEIHPELSSGTVTVSENFTIPEKDVTQVTTNIMVRDGCTVVIGGLIREQLDSNTTQIPLLGSLPLVGPVFRSKQNQTTKRDEIVILLTPHILRDPQACSEGAQAACESHRRRDVMAEKLSPLGRDHVARRYFRLAQNAWALGDRDNALHYAEMSVHFNPGNRTAIDLRSHIWMGRPYGGQALPGPPSTPGAQPTVQSTEALPPWILQELQQVPDQSAHASDPSGDASSSTIITKPGNWR